jgi:hypothetical protein
MKFRTLLLGLSALFVAFNAAFFSVSGLSKLFAGASFSVMLMASSLEAAKLITAGYLYNYWEKINKAFRWYLVSGVLILVLITSLGIYGFLTSAFQDTFNQFSVNEKEKTFLQQKEKFYSDDVARYDAELQRISNNISTLSNAKSQSIQVRDTSVVGGVRTTISTAELRLAQSRINVEEENRKGVQEKREVAADSLQSIQLKILDLDTNLEGASELGPLQYLSGLTGYGMDKIINWLILIIIFVFDPLAVALVVAFNNALKVDKGEKDKKKVVEKRELYGEEPDREELLQKIVDNDQEMGLWDNTLQDGLEDEEWDESHGLDQVLNDMVEDLDEDDLKDTSSPKKIEGKNVTLTKPSDVQKIFDKADLNKDGIVTEEEKKQYYESGGWKNAHNGNPYYTHPWFDWNKRERWINDRGAINYWMKNRGGSEGQLEKIKEQYPSDFTTKTY